MNVRTICWFLLGRRAAIERIAACPRAVWVGLLLVLSAGLAREYDGEDLLAEPYHVLVPLVASLGTSAGLFALLRYVAKHDRHRQEGRRDPNGYRQFLGSYWMTAPLAWLYAIPVERFLSSYDATVANLWLLAVVALWRVLLMIRVVAVLFRASALASASVVLLFADLIVLPLVPLFSNELVGMMGGIRGGPTQMLAGDVSAAICAAGFYTLPVWLIGTVTVAASRSLTWPNWQELASDAREANPIAPSVWRGAVVMLLFGLVLVATTYREQQRRREVERLFWQGDVRRAVAKMAATPADAFPPHWDPPPRFGPRGPKPPLIDVFEALVEVDAPDWLWPAYQPKLAYELWDLVSKCALDERIAPEDRELLQRWLTVCEAMPNQRQFAIDNVNILLRISQKETRAVVWDIGFRQWLQRNGIDVSDESP